jgi:xanthine dehydrogenase accessory factor
VRHVTDTIWDLIAQETKARRPVACATVVRDSGSVPRRSGAKMLVYPDRRTHGTVGGGTFELLVIRDTLAALDAGASVTHTYSFNPKGTSDDAFGAVCGGTADVFLEVIMPPDRLLIVGGGHCGHALAKAASLLDFSIVVADDREEYTRPEDYAFANVESVLRLPPSFEGLPAPDERTYIALVSKGFLTDEAALRRVIDTPAAYMGMIGSLKKRETVYDRLRADGYTEAQLARVHAPIGLEIAAESPQEIAISILAQVIQARAKLRSHHASRPTANGDGLPSGTGVPARACEVK